VDRPALMALKRRRRRLANASFFVAGIGFGTLLYFLRARFTLLGEEGRWAGLAELLVGTLGAFYLGARADAEAHRIDDELSK
jgi:hypothetical protein